MFQNELQHSRREIYFFAAFRLGGGRCCGRATCCVLIFLKEPLLKRTTGVARLAEKRDAKGSDETELLDGVDGELVRIGGNEDEGENELDGDCKGCCY